MSWINTELIKIQNEELKSKIKIALLKIWEQEKYYLENDVSEVSLTNKLGCYLQSIFTDYHVDCEYNRHYDRVKKINVRTGEENAKPDIIIHTRGTDRNNYLVIEAKKANNRNRVNEVSGIDYDQEKLKAYLKEDLYYKMSIYVEFNIGNDLSVDNFIKRIEFYSRVS